MKRGTMLGRDESKKKKPSPIPRNPLTNLNTISRSNSSNSSSSLSVEAPPKGCLSFFLPTSSSSSSSKTTQKPKPLLPKTPKSAPISRPSKPRSKLPTPKIPEKPLLQKSKSKSSTPSLRNGKNPSFGAIPSQPRPSKVVKEEPFQKQGQWQIGRIDTGEPLGKNPSFGAIPSQPKPSKVVKEEPFQKQGQWQMGRIDTDEPLGKNPSFGAIPSQPKPSKVVKEEPFQKQGQWKMSRIDTGELFDNNLFKFGITSLDDSRNVTPLSKLACGSSLVAMEEENSIDDSKTSTTPPVQASISPEIQCGSSMSSMTTPTCFGAGHVLSGVSDKRKCRPRGILTVGEELGFCKARVSDSDSDDEGLFLNKSRVSLIPAPCEASMHWLLSPCKEEEDLNGSPELRRLMGPTPFHSLSSPSSADGFAPDVCGNSNSSRNTGSSIKRACFVSPPSGIPASLSPSVFQISPSDHLVYCSSPSFSATTTTSCKAVFSKEDIGYRYEYATENSPLSVDSLGSQNVIRTPQSDSGSDKPIGFSWLKNAVDENHQEYRFELDSMTEVLQKTSLSPENQTSRWNPAADVLPLPGFSFQFANSASPSNFIDQVDLQKTCNDRFWQVSGSSFGNVSQSRSRISWREGLVSRIFYMDELDCCRWSSDEEADVNCCVNDQFNSDIGCKLDKNIENDPTLISASKSPEIVFKEPKIDVRSKGKSKKYSPCQIPNSCAESISTEGGGLIASGDSDWTLCYKNQLFQE